MYERLRPEIDEIKRLYAAGVSTTRIAHKYKAGEHTIAHLLKEAGVELRGPRGLRVWLDRARVVKMYQDEGKPAEAVALEMNTSPFTIRRRLRSWGIEIRPKGGRMGKYGNGAEGA